MASPQRPVRIASCSGAVPDPGYHMYNQAKYGPVDVITGDYLAEINLGNDAEAYTRGEHPGWCQTAWDGLEMSAELLAEKKIKVVINGGSLNPKGLALKVHELVKSKGLDLTVAYVEGDNLLPRIDEILSKAKEDVDLPHLDNSNANVKLEKDSKIFLEHPEWNPIVSANAYLGGRAIRKGLEEGADIIICGRVADASPVIGAAAWWHQWKHDDFDALAGALIAGHLIECSSYITGANFAGFFEYEISELLNLGLGIVEIEANGDCIVTKHEALNGFVTADTVKCQFLYELQGNIYLNSDVKADTTNIVIEEVGKDRVKVSGTKGHPPPPTTKLAVFYKGGYQAEMLFNATGYATAKKFALLEAQIKDKLQEWKQLEKLDVLDFQWVGRPESNPSCQLASTTYLRVFAQAQDKNDVAKVFGAFAMNTMQHFAGFHSSLDFRTAMPKPYIAFYPGIIEQADLDEGVSLLDKSTASVSRHAVGPPTTTEPLAPREDHDPTSPVDLSSFGETVMAAIGDVVLGRSGDKGANVNIGLFVHTDEEWAWLRSLLTKAKLKEMMGTDWQDWYYLERVEMPQIKAVHFVVYGPLGRGVTSSRLLDALGKGFSEFIRAVHVPIPKKFLQAGGSKTNL
ncbi:Putative acyclic terpene utilization [Septoria linicola]|uniref:Acyclic terpene utilization n=1 Tax=Septoria linicola TaxID=215465 RepID=A0A9Q9AQF1_9PEZI|nr:putative acyclic terpene utilization [Septoria linicola]USW53195.1 Putative acyclic terpene utilization [Septoria linicola]